MVSVMHDDMTEGPDPNTGSLKLLKALVITLLVVMIAGFIVLIGFLVTRFPSGEGVPLPEEITLPDGTAAQAFTATVEWYAVVTEAGEILIYNRADGALRQRIEVAPGPDE
jgi:hypothetical protein